MHHVLNRQWPWMDCTAVEQAWRALSCYHRSMHVALIANTAWLDEELMQFRHLITGLMDEGVRISQVVPTGLAEGEVVSFGTRLTWRDEGWAILRRRNVAKLADELANANVTVLHALDGRVWKGTYDLAEKLALPCVFQANAKFDLPVAKWMSRRFDASRMAFAPTTEPLSAALEQILGPQALIKHITPGAYVADEPTAAVRIEQMTRDANQGVLCAVISGNAQADEDYEAFFEALPPILGDFPQMQCFIDNMGLSQHELWQLASRCGLLSNLSFIPRKLGHRELLLKADVLIHPQALHKSRGLTLQAMASGMPVIARKDDWLDYLENETNSWVIDRADPEPWRRCLRMLFMEPTKALELGRRARQWVQERRPVSLQVDAVRMLYHQVSGEGIKIGG